MTGKLEYGQSGNRAYTLIARHCQKIKKLRLMFTFMMITKTGVMRIVILLICLFVPLTLTQ